MFSVLFRELFIYLFRKICRSVALSEEGRLETVDAIGASSGEACVDDGIFDVDGTTVVQGSRFTNVGDVQAPGRPPVSLTV